MICTKCKKTVYRAHSYEDSEGVWHSGECDDCAAGYYSPAWTTTEKIKSRTLRPDGSVATGLEGIKLRDLRRRSQALDNRR